MKSHDAHTHTHTHHPYTIHTHTHHPPHNTHTQTDPDSKETSDFDWWSKYYYSCGDERRTQAEYVEQGADKLVVYPTELEEAFNRYSPPLVLY